MTPVVTIIGRTNVGKSTLFNRITRTRRAIVANEPGVTRDRIMGLARYNDRPFILTDTGGFEDPHGEYIKERMLEQTRLGLEEADIVLFMVDGQAGLLPADEDVADQMRRSNKRVLLVVNKVDLHGQEDERMAEFYGLGINEIFPVSSEHALGLDELLDALTQDFPEDITAESEPEEHDYEAFDAAGDESEDADFDDGDERSTDGYHHPAVQADESEDDEIEEEEEGGEDATSVAREQLLGIDRPVRIAIVGRPNVGKSSLINKLLGYDRMVVHDQAGTTRDAIDTAIEWEGKKFVLVDTAGVRRKARVSDKIEKFSVIKAFGAIAECDVAILVLDATLGAEDQDARIAGMIVDEGRGMVVAFNKWDVPEGRQELIKELKLELNNRMKFLPDPPVAFVSAKTGQRITKLLEHALDVARENTKRIKTAKFNQMLLAAVERHKPPMHANTPVKFYYAAQIGQRPPTFALQTNLPQGVHFSYQRFLENFIREQYGFEGAPIRLKFREKKKNKRYPKLKPQMTRTPQD